MTVAPNRCSDMDHTSGAEWYSGAGHRYTVRSASLCAPMPRAMITGADAGSPNAVPGSCLRTPFGRPVVPEEYSISRPSRSSSSGPAGAAASRSS